MTFQDDNGNQLEVSGSFAMTKQAVSFFNGKIRGDVSTTFQVDNNSINREVLQYQGPQMLNQVAWTKQAFNRVRNGNILDRGYIVIQSDNGETLSCFYVSGNSNWVQSLNGLITELEWPINEQNASGLLKYYRVRTYSPPTQANLNGTDLDGLVFPLVDWSYNLKKGDKRYYTASLTDITGNIDYTFSDFYPCLYVHSLVEQIGLQSDIKFSGDLFTDPIFKSLVIPPTNGEMKGPAFKNVYAAGSNQTGFGAGQTKYTSFTEVNDPEKLFNDNTYTSVRYRGVKLTLTYRTPSAGTIVAYIKSNGATVTFNTLSNTRTQIIVRGFNLFPGDFVEIYASAGTATAATFDLLIETPETISVTYVLNPSNFLPKLKKLDVIKFLINYFGTSCYYNEYTRTLTANIIENMKLEDASDWSEYYISHRNEYTVEQAKNNYIKFDDGVDPEIKAYNRQNTINFGSGNIKTDNTLKEERDLFTFPFLPSGGGLSKNGFYQVNVPLINLIDEPGIAYTAMASGGTAPTRTTYTIPSDTYNWNTGEIIRITDVAGYSRGYFMVYASGSSTTVDIIDEFVATSTGRIYRQKVEFLEAGPRILTLKQNTAALDFSGLASFFINNNGSIEQTTSNWGIATFTKEQINRGLDQWKNNLVIDNPTGNFIDPTIKELYYNKISRFFNSPKIIARMILPEAVYQSFKFDKFIYLKTEKLTGYFFVDSIVNYVDSDTPVEVNLYMYGN